MESKPLYTEVADINYHAILSKVILLTPDNRRLNPDGGRNVLLQYCPQYSFEEFKKQISGPLVSLPNAIIILYNNEFSEEIYAFGRQLAQKKKLKPVPILLAASPDDINDLQSDHSSMTSFDDLISSTISKKKLIYKIRLLKKIKEINLSDRQALIEQSDGLQTHGYIKMAAKGFKRLIDILCSATLLILLSPLFIIIAILIKIDSRGPVFYAGYRTGTDYRVFRFLKFRTMIPGADKGVKSLENQYSPESGTGPIFYKFKNDPRVTKFGSFLRKTSLDELPQFINVLIGDMSLVGNRPLPLYEAQTLTVDEYVERFDAPAGITGLWQIRKRGKKDMSVKERISLDIFYARHRSLALDMKILLETPKAMMQEEDV